MKLVSFGLDLSPLSGSFVVRFFPAVRYPAETQQHGRPGPCGTPGLVPRRSAGRTQASVGQGDHCGRCTESQEHQVRRRSGRPAPKLSVFFLSRSR